MNRNRESKTDVAIWGMTNHISCIALRRVAKACVASRLATTLVWSDQPGLIALTPEDYDIPGLYYHKAKIRVDYGILRLSRPALWPLIQRSVTKVFDSLRPGCIITQLDHVGSDKVFHHVAKAKGIPGIVLQEGMVNVPKDFDSKALKTNDHEWIWGRRDTFDRMVARIPHPLLQTVAPYMFAQYVCVWGDAMKDHLLRMGRDPKTVIMTGSHALDHVENRRSLNRNKSRTVLYVQQRMALPFDIRRVFYKQIIDTVTRQLECKLIFKFHRNSITELAQVRALAAESSIESGRLVFVCGGDAVDLLNKVSVVVLASSTTAYHAALAGVPLVIVDYYSPKTRFEFGVENPVSVVNHPGELRDTLHRCLSDQSFRERMYEEGADMLRYHLKHLDGKAADRIADFVSRLVSEN